MALYLVACDAGGGAPPAPAASAPALDDPEAAFVEDALEGALEPEFEVLNATAKYSVATAPAYSAEAFSEGVKKEVRELFGLDGCLPFSAAPLRIEGPWTIHETGSRGLLKGHVWYASPGGPRGRPVLVVSDGASEAAVLAGRREPRYPGEAVARALYDAGHPVLIMSLKGFEEPKLPDAWGIPGADYYASMLKARGLDRQTEWVRDAHDSMCLLKRLEPAERYGVVGVSKSAILAALVALLHPDVDSVYLASGFSRFEEEYPLNYGWAYAPGERLRFTRNAVLLSLFDRRVRLSFSDADHPFYGKEARQRLLLGSLTAVHAKWRVPGAVVQHTHGFGHYFDCLDVTEFFSSHAPRSGGFR
jgi:hypothetical protein